MYFFSRRQSCSNKINILLIFNIIIYQKFKFEIRIRDNKLTDFGSSPKIKRALRLKEGLLMDIFIVLIELSSFPLT